MKKDEELKIVENIWLIAVRFDGKLRPTSFTIRVIFRTSMHKDAMTSLNLKI